MTSSHRQREKFAGDKKAPPCWAPPCWAPPQQGAHMWKVLFFFFWTRGYGTFLSKDIRLNGAGHVGGLFFLFILLGRPHKKSRSETDATTVLDSTSFRPANQWGMSSHMLFTRHRRRPREDLKAPPRSRVPSFAQVPQSRSKLPRDAS